MWLHGNRNPVQHEMPDISRAVHEWVPSAWEEPDRADASRCPHMQGGWFARKPPDEEIVGNVLQGATQLWSQTRGRSIRPSTAGCVSLRNAGSSARLSAICKMWVSISPQPHNSWGWSETILRKLQLQCWCTGRARCTLMHVALAQRFPPATRVWSPSAPTHRSHLAWAPGRGQPEGISLEIQHGFEEGANKGLVATK